MSWVELDPVGETNPAGRQGHTICSIDGKTKQEMVVFGGAQGPGVKFNDVWSLDLTFFPKVKWTEVPCLGQKPPGRSSHSCNLVGDTMYIMGGDPIESAFMHALTLGAEAWTWASPNVMGKPPPGRYGHATAIVENSIYCFAGHNGKVGLNDLCVLNLGTKDSPPTWNYPVLSGTYPSPGPKYKGMATRKGARDWQIFFIGAVFTEVNVLDVSQKEWSTPDITGSPPLDRIKHACVCSNFRDIYIFGGAAGEDGQNDMAVLDTKELLWAKSDYGGDIPTVRLGHTLALVNENKLVVFGGATVKNEVKDDSFVVDLSTAMLKWELLNNATGQIPKQRCGHMGVIVDEAFIVVGGADGARVLADVNVLETAGSKLMWSQPIGTGISPDALVFHGVGVQIEENKKTGVRFGHLYVFGGGDGRRAGQKLHHLNMHSMRWSEIVMDPKNEVVPESRAGHAMCQDIDSKTKQTHIYMFGGYCGGVGFLNDLYKLDCSRPSKPMWLKPRCKGDPPPGRLQHTMNMYNNRLFIFGGTGNKMVFNDLAMYVCDKGEWSFPKTEGTPPEPRFGHATALAGHKLFLYGGGQRAKHFNDLQILDLEELVWSKPRIDGIAPTARSRMFMVYINKCIFMFGGTNGSIYFNELYKIRNISTDKKIIDKRLRKKKPAQSKDAAELRAEAKLKAAMEKQAELDAMPDDYFNKLKYSIAEKPQDANLVLKMERVRIKRRELKYLREQNKSLDYGSHVNQEQDTVFGAAAEEEDEDAREVYLTIDPYEMRLIDWKLPQGKASKHSIYQLMKQTPDVSFYSEMFLSNCIDMKVLLKMTDGDLNMLGLPEPDRAVERTGRGDKGRLNAFLIDSKRKMRQAPFHGGHLEHDRVYTPASSKTEFGDRQGHTAYDRGSFLLKDENTVLYSGDTGEILNEHVNIRREEAYVIKTFPPHDSHDKSERVILGTPVVLKFFRHLEAFESEKRILEYFNFVNHDCQPKYRVRQKLDDEGTTGESWAYVENCDALPVARGPYAPIIRMMMCHEDRVSKPGFEVHCIVYEQPDYTLRDLMNRKELERLEKTSIASWLADVLSELHRSVNHAGTADLRKRGLVVCNLTTDSIVSINGQWKLWNLDMCNGRGFNVELQLDELTGDVECKNGYHMPIVLMPPEWAINLKKSVSRPGKLSTFPIQYTVDSWRYGAIIWEMFSGQSFCPCIQDGGADGGHDRNGLNYKRAGVKPISKVHDDDKWVIVKEYTLAAFANQHGIESDLVLRLNGMAPGATVIFGQRLRIASGNIRLLTGLSMYRDDWDGEQGPKPSVLSLIDDSDCRYVARRCLSNDPTKRLVVWEDNPLDKLDEEMRHFGGLKDTAACIMRTALVGYESGAVHDTDVEKWPEFSSNDWGLKGYDAKTGSSPDFRSNEADFFGFMKFVQLRMHKECQTICRNLQVDVTFLAEMKAQEMPPDPPLDELWVSLKWEAGCDLDIYCVTPGGITLMYNNMAIGNPQEPWATLDVDTTGAAKGLKEEKVIIKGYAPAGDYIFKVKYQTGSTPVAWKADISQKGFAFARKGHFTTKQLGTIQDIAVLKL